MRRPDCATLLTGTAILLAALGLARPVRAAGGALLPPEACKKALAAEEAGDKTVSSRGPCSKAYLVYGGANENIRNEVESLMSPARVPTLDDLAVAALLAEAAYRRASSEPWSYLARCDIARRLHNADALAACLADLKRVAPSHPATKWMLLAAQERTPTGVWILRLLLLAGFGVTLGHALRRTFLARRHRGTAATSFALITAWTIVLGLGGPARAASLQPAMGQLPRPPVSPKDHLSSFLINDDDPESSVPPVDEQTLKPLQFGYFLQDLAAKAEHASGKGDHKAAARYYGALSKAAPTVVYGPREMCVELEAAGDLDTAIRACRTAVTRLGATVSDYARFVGLVLASKKPLPPEERKELDTVIDHLEKDGNAGALPTVLRCDVDLRFKDYPALEACSKQLASKAPKDPKAISFQWAVALEKQDRGQALALIDRARTVGMPNEAIARMERATRTMTLKRTALFAILLAALAGAGYALVRYRRESLRRRLAV